MLISRMKWCVLVAAVLLALVAAGCRRPQAEKEEVPKPTAAPAPQPEASAPAQPGGQSEALAEARKLGIPTDAAVVTTDSGLQYIEVKEGQGAAVNPGDVAVVHYSGWLTDATKFDSSVDRGEPLRFRVGAGRVIKGWDEGVVGMKPGGVRKLIIPPELGYGSRSVGPIPPDSTLIFEVELLKVE